MVTRSEIAHTESLIRPYIRRTPIIETNGSDFGAEDCTVIFKLELCQHAGSFKVRGAFANLLSCEVPPAGVVAASGGNHGVAVAYAAAKVGIRATIFVPSIASQAKIAKIRDSGAQLVIAGDRYADALLESEAFARQSGAMQIHAYDQRETLLGQGTLALELEQQAPDLDCVLVTVGGGGLIGGAAAWFADRVRVVAVEPETAPTLSYALAAGEPVDAPAGGIAADSLAPRRVGTLMFPIAKSHVDKVVLVPDDAIRDAQTTLWSSLRIAAEPGGAAAAAALFADLYKPARGERVGIVICGGNTTAVDFSAGGI